MLGYLCVANPQSAIFTEFLCTNLQPNSSFPPKKLGFLVFGKTDKCAKKNVRKKNPAKKTEIKNPEKKNFGKKCSQKKFLDKKCLKKSFPGNNFPKKSAGKSQKKRARRAPPFAAQG